jgi:two-component system cell cycle response regulator DivK
MTKRILVVEDQEDNRQIVRDLLTANDYEMTEAENGEEALAAVAKERPDLILMDIQLPIMDGYEATRRIKADPTLKNVPIIAVTSYALSGDEDKARAAGCDDFVPKPYSPRQLLAKIRGFLRYPPLWMHSWPHQLIIGDKGHRQYADRKRVELPLWVMDRRTRREHFSSAALSITDDLLHRNILLHRANNRHPRSEKSNLIMAAP